jgi:hypothetical protein
MPTLDLVVLREFSWQMLDKTSYFVAKIMTAIFSRTAFVQKLNRLRHRKLLLVKA